MSKILVAIDFSECSINAFLHALSLAQHCKNNLHLIWVNKSGSEKEKFSQSKPDPSLEVEKAFRELVAKYQPELPGNEITWVIRTGKVYLEVAAEAKSCKAMMVIAGTHGASGFEEFWIGSNANRIIAVSPCPVITIRGGINIRRPLTSIIMPIDSTLETRQKATFTGHLAKCHGATIHIVRMYTSKIKDIRSNVDLYAQQTARYYEKEEIRHDLHSLESGHLSDDMIEMAKKLDANLISIMTEQETRTSNIWMGPFAHQTVNHSPIPVLSIHPKETLASGQGF